MNQLGVVATRLASDGSSVSLWCARARFRLAKIAGGALLASQLCRALAQEENQAAFRQEFYKEEDNRIQVNTQSVYFDTQVAPNIRLNGSLVLDAISGATPTGAPPPSKWQYPSYTDYYNNYYTEAYNSQYSQYTAANQVFVDAGLITYQQMTNDAATYASTTAPPIATNSATASFQTLTNNPKYKSNRVPLTHMDDNRTAVALGAAFTLGPHLISPSFAYSEESDYISYVGGLNYAYSFNEKNTTANLGWAHNGDSVRNDLFKWESKTVDSFLVGGVQLLSPKAFVTFSFTYVNENGYLSDPYRGVMFTTTNFNELQTNPDDGATEVEKRPGHRDRQISYVSYSQFIDPLRGGLECGYRFSIDSWNVQANTFDVQWHQKIGRKVVLTPSFRYHVQSAADFYYPGLVPGGADQPKNYSSDYRLSHMETFTYGLQVMWRVAKHLSVEAGYQRYVMKGLDSTSSSAYPVANVYSLGGRIWF